MKTLAVVVTLILLAAAAALGFVTSGRLDVSAAAHDPGWLRWLLKTTREHSVERHAAGIAVPDLSRPGQAAAGAHAFDEMCAGCHGAPGREPFLGAPYMNPPPPKLAEGNTDLSPAELFWVIKHGIRMTGMPAWGPTHPDGRLWELVAFIRHLPTLSPADYQHLVEQGAATEETHGHHHGSLGPAQGEGHDHATRLSRGASAQALP
jgi:mono/diheme cytochrome c family protein